MKTPPTPISQITPTVSGKFFRLGEAKFYLKGVTYGPFRPNNAGKPFPERAQTARDFELIRALGANLLRVYHVPPRWLLDLAEPLRAEAAHRHSLEQARLFPGFPGFSPDEACAAVRAAVQSCARHPAVFAYSVVNELPPDIVRWSGAARGGKLSGRTGAGGQGGRSRMPLHLRQLSADRVFEPAKHRFHLLQRLSAPAAALRELPGPPADDRRIQAADPG